ncbi:hypothetical protein [Desulforegula conservatrix]|uniref:hypothetical protein n=1 Tax=Desulforegula conservatrix TaxID=153026 RepID=UPI00041C79E9|nr:hypothetical protein [Desulforegula conservatrix]
MDTVIFKSEDSKKEKYKNELMEFWSILPPGELSRQEIARQALGISKQAMYKHFTPEELDEIEKQCLEIRRQRYSLKLMKVDDTVFRRAIAGNIPAAKLCYQRFEGWNPNQKIEKPREEEVTTFSVRFTDEY